MENLLALNPIENWLRQFNQKRNLKDGPNGQELYLYAVNFDEFFELRSLLSKNSTHAFHPLYKKSWAAGFCLFVAEWYRREYDAQWSWKEVERQLNHSFTPQERGELVNLGLKKYWKRPIRKVERGKNFLGSLFLEGGLPWPLVQSDKHIFGKAVRSGLKKYYSIKTKHKNIIELIDEYDLPQTFDKENAKRLLAGIIEKLTILVEKYVLTEQDDPFQYLDDNEPNWRKGFPIPLDKENAKSLVNDWLKDASKKREEHIEEENKLCSTFEEGNFIYNHYLINPNSSEWYLQFEINLPAKLSFDIELKKLSTTRVFLAIFEGEKLLAECGPIYGKIDNDELLINLPQRDFILNRDRLDKPIGIKIFESGSAIDQIYFPNSIFNIREVPLIFYDYNNKLTLASVSSCSLPVSKALVHLPISYSIKHGHLNKQIKLTDGSTWVEINDDLNISIDNEVFFIKLNTSIIQTHDYFLSGEITNFESTPITVYKGWPKLITQQSSENLENLIEFVNKKLITRGKIENEYGYFQYQIKDKHGATLLHRKFGVLPEEFTISINPESDKVPACITILSNKDLEVTVENINISSEIKKIKNNYEIYLHHKQKHPPTFVTLYFKSKQEIKPIKLHIPYPYLGARLLDKDNNIFPKSEVLIDELLGAKLILYSGFSYTQDFSIQLELVNHSNSNPKRSYKIKVHNKPLIVNLFNYQFDLTSLLGATDEQDAHINLTIFASGSQILNIKIRRYNGKIDFKENYEFSISDIDSDRLNDNVKAEAMLLSEPEQKPISIGELCSENVGIQRFRIPNLMLKNGPWLIYPTKDSMVKFRPRIFNQENSNNYNKNPIHSLHQACKSYNPQSNPDLIDEQVLFMSDNLKHSGWDYFLELKKNFDHLPLSTFESWKALSKNQEALSIAFFRLDMRENFCERFSNELAIIWETIPLALWASAYKKYKLFLEDKLPENIIVKTLNKKTELLNSIILSNLDNFEDYLNSMTTEGLFNYPIETLLSQWYQDLRRNHAHDIWPTELGYELSDWINQQELPNSIKNLSVMAHTNSVTYLPIFLAYVTTGKITINSLRINEGYLKFVIRIISDFDKYDWFKRVHTLMVSYLLKTEGQN